MIDEQAGQSTPAPTLLGWTVPSHLKAWVEGSDIRVACMHFHAADTTTTSVPLGDDDAPTLVGHFLRDHSHGAKVEYRAVPPSSVSPSGENPTPVGAEGQDDDSTAQGAIEAERYSPPGGLVEFAERMRAEHHWRPSGLGCSCGRSRCTPLLLLDLIDTPADDTEDESDLAKLEVLVGPRNDLPFDQWAEQTMRRVLDRIQQLRVSVAGAGRSLNPSSSPLPDSETEWGWRHKDECESWTRVSRTESGARVLGGRDGWLLLKRRAAGPWIEVTS